MKRTTHILLGAAVAMPIAASSSPLLAAGAVWWGMVGGGYPDWFDLRSDFSPRLKHRGTSHSLFLGVVFTFALWWVLGLLADQFSSIDLGQDAIDAWALAFGAGFLSHILADACTRGGVRPFLPFSGRKWWILPGWLRGTSEGTPDAIARVLALVVVLVGVIGYLSQQAAW
jgi:membrane-bound metal-dependent hydrolase YbcI (DUF457 family)